MSIPANPNVMGAIVTRLRSFSEILAFVSTPSGYSDDASAADRAVPRIASSQQASWALPKFALELGNPIASPNVDRVADHEGVRLDMRFWGPNETEAMRFWRSADPCIVPPLYLRIGSDFVSNGIIFRAPQREGGPGRLRDESSHNWFVLATYVFTYALQPVGP